MSRIKDTDKLLIFEQLLALLQSGVPLPRIFEIMGREAPLRIGRAFSAMAPSLGEGKPLSESMQGLPIFSNYDREMIAAGEKAGDLTASIRQLTELYRERTLAPPTSGATPFLIFEIILVILLTALLHTFMVPTFTSMFWDMGLGYLPGLTRMVVSFSYWIVNSYGWVFMLALIVILPVAAYLLKTGRNPYFHRALTDIPVAGKRWALQEAGIFALFAGRALQAGVAAGEAISHSTDALGNYYLRRNLKLAAAKVKEGQSWAEAVAGIKKMPASFKTFVRLGEKNGDLAPALVSFGEITGNALQKSFGPQYIVGMAIFIAFMVYVMLVIIAMYLPLFQMVGRFGD